MDRISEEIFIQKVTVEVTTVSTETAKSVEKNIHVFLEEQVFPQIEKWLSERIDLYPRKHLLLSNLALTMEVDPQQFQSIDLQPVLKKQISKQLLQQLEGLDLDRLAHLEETNLPPLSRENLKRWSELDPIDHFNSNELKDKELVFYKLLSEVQKGFYAWLHFLEYGTKPWFANSMNPMQMMYARQASDWVLLQEFSRLAIDILRMPQARIRLLLQHGLKDIAHLLTHLINQPKYLDRFHQLNQRFDPPIQRFNYILFLTCWLEKQFGDKSFKKQVDSLQMFHSLATTYPIPKNEWARLWQQVSNIYGFESQIETILSIAKLDQSHFDDIGLGNATRPKTQSNLSLQSQITELEPDKITVKEDYNHPMIHAGLILLHPFLLAFFQDVKIVGKDKRIIDSLLGLHLLHYVATGKLKPYEFELGFEKFLVGWDLSAPYNKEVNISKSQLDKCDLLLESLKGNWNKLKNTGRETIQTGFLQREGKLVEDGDRYRLIVERKAQDVLLRGLPYTLGVVKLPWQKKLVFVEW